MSRTCSMCDELSIGDYGRHDKGHPNYEPLQSFCWTCLQKYRPDTADYMRGRFKVHLRVVEGDKC